MPTYSWTLSTTPTPDPGGGGAASVVTVNRGDATGVDIYCLDDIDPHFRLVSGAVNVGCALARRLSTPRGHLHYAQAYGRDVTAHLNDEVSTKALQAMRKDVQTEASADERVKSVQVSATWDPVADTIRIEIKGTTRAGPFRLIRSASELSNTVLEGDA